MALPRSIDLHALQQHDRRLRRLATAVLCDAHGGEDVAQETWCRALECAAREPHALRAWLQTIARRLAVNERRGRGRRSRREEAVARPEALPSSADVAAWVEVQTRVVRVLESLAEPHRSVLRDRYFGDLSPGELALRDGLAVKTIQQRLRRARSVMRAALAHEGITEHHEARGGLLLVAPVWTTLGTSILMKKLGLVLLLLVGTALVVKREAWNDAENTLSPAVAVASKSGLQSEPAGFEDLAAGTPEETAERSPISGAGTNAPVVSGVPLPWTIPGRVRIEGVDPAAPLPEVSLQLEMYAGYEAAGDPLEAASVTSNAAGGFEWACDDPGRTVTIVVTPAPAEDLSFSPTPPVLAVVGEGPPVGLIVRAALRNAWIEGRVTEAESSRELPGARVVYNDVESTTDARGEYRVRVPSEGFGAIIADADGFRRGGGSPGGLAPGKVARVDVALQPNGGPELDVHGYVRDALGMPIVGARVACRAHEVGTLTDVTGHYRMRNVPLDPEVYLEITAAAAGYAECREHVRQSASGPPDERGTQLDFTLHAGARLEGSVRDAAGTRVAGARIWIGPDARFATNRSTYSRDDGYFSFDGVPAGPTKLGAQKANFPERVLEIDVPSAQDGPLVLDIRFAPAVTLRGAIVDDLGTPIEGALVHASPAADSIGSSASAGTAARSDAEGAFFLRGLPNEGLRLRVTGDNLVPLTLELDPNDAPANLVVTRATRFAGRVLDDATGRAVEVFRVRLMPPEDPGLAPWFEGMDISWLYGGRTFQSIDGRWATDARDPLRAGLWTALEVEAPGYRVLRLEAVQAPPRGSPDELELRLTRE